jgi:WD40 repeat protein
VNCFANTDDFSAIQIAHPGRRGEYRFPDSGSGSLGFSYTDKRDWCWLLGGGGVNMASGSEVRAQMREAVHRAAARMGGPRQATGISLVALLCASALAPVVAAGMAVGPVLLAGMGLAGSVGAGALTDVVEGALEALRGRGEEREEEEVEQELAARLEAALSSADASGAALREAVAGLLRELGAVQGAVAEGLAGLGVQFAEFAFVADDIRRTVFTIDESMRVQRAEFRAVSQRSREEVLRLTRALEATGSGVQGVSEGAWPGCPYLGLVPFSAQEKQVFYGRRDLTLRLRQALADRLSVGGVLLVTGPSGAGKSSLLRAGLVPALAQDVLAPGSGRWPCRVLTPTGSPLRELAAYLADLSGREPGSVYALLALNPQRAADLAEEGLRGIPLADVDSAGSVERVPGRLILIVDQFEELFTVAVQGGAGREERDAFVAALEALATPRSGESTAVGAFGMPVPSRLPVAQVVVSVRGDFLDQAFSFPVLARAQEAGPFVVGPMTEAELRLAVTGPAAEARLGVEPELVDELVREVRDRPDALTLGSGVLPLVSQVMAAVWHERQDERLTLVAYRRAGGLADAVDRSAQEAYRGLGEVLQPVARSVFLRLTLVTGDGRVARRRVGRTELYRAAGQPAPAVDTVIEAFAARRLLVLERDEVEISHEVLLHTWAELQGWLAGDRVDQAVYGQLVTDAESWQTHGGEAGYLYSGGRLEDVTAARARWLADPARYPALPQSAEEFLDAGKSAGRRRVRRRRGVIAGLSALALLAVTAALGAGAAANLARRDDAHAQAANAVALSRQLAAESLTLDQTDALAARQLAVAAWSVSPTDQARDAMTSLLEEQAHSMLLGHHGTVYDVVYSPNGKLLASAGLDGTVRLWDPTTQKQIGATITADPAGGAVNGVAFSPNGLVMASADGNGTVKLWDTTTQKQIGTTIIAAPMVTGVDEVAFDPANGQVLASADGNGTVKLWDTTTQKRIATINAGLSDTGGAYGVAFSPSGLLASADGDGTVRLWDTTTRKQIGATITANPTGGAVYGVAFSPNGLLASADGDGTVRLWDTTTRKQAGATIDADSAGGAVYGVAFSPNGLLASADGDGTVRLWDTTTQKLIGTTITADPTGGAVHGVAFSPNGLVLASADQSGTVRLWDTTTREQVDTITANPTGGAVYGVAFSPNGLLASADGDGTVRLWDTTTRKQIGATITANLTGGAVYGVAFSPNGLVLASAEEDGTVKLWDTTTHKEIGSIIADPTGGAVYGVAFSPNGLVLASADGDGTVRLWDTTTLTLIDTITISTNPTGGAVYGVAFNPKDGRVLATADSDGTVRLWEPYTEEQIGTLINDSSEPEVRGVAFSPNGLLASADEDGTVRLWDTTTQKQVGTTIYPTAAGAVVYWAAFSPNGQMLARAEGESTVQLLETDWITNPYPTLCAYVGPPSVQVWAQYEPSEPEPAVCQ